MPDDPGLWLTLLLIALGLFAIGIALSGVRWQQLSINPWLSARAAIAAAIERGETRFWMVWAIFSTAVVLAITATFVGSFRLLGD
jgi:hypothetical protein